MSHHGAASLAQTDTSPRAMQRYFERVRATAPRDRLERALRLSEQVRSATMSDVRKRNAGASETDIATAFLRRVYGDAIADAYAARHRP